MNVVLGHCAATKASGNNFYSNTPRHSEKYESQNPYHFVDATAKYGIDYHGLTILAF